MKLVIIFGPQAVGKMTVGQELEKITGLKLFHNHMSIDFVSNFFSYSTKEGQRLVILFRDEIFKAVAKSDLDGLIFTFVWGFDYQSEWDYIENICKIFEDQGGTVYFVELETDLKTRIERNKSPNRLEHKPLKRDVERFEKELIDSMNKYRMNSHEGEIKRENFIKIDNTDLSAEKAAEIIKEKFGL